MGMSTGLPELIKTTPAHLFARNQDLSLPLCISLHLPVIDALSVWPGGQGNPVCCFRIKLKYLINARVF